MGQEISSLRQLRPELFRETDQPVLMSASLKRLETWAKFLTCLSLSVSGIECIKVFIIHVNSIQIILLNPGCESIGSGNWVSVGGSRDVRRPKYRNDELNSGCGVLGFNA